ncbi:MAG: endonuclease III [Syntrophales bacterium]|jgi:endonuclease-3
MKDLSIIKVIHRLRQVVKAWEEPIVSQMARRRQSPFALLISTLLSLRTKDEVTATATERLLALAQTPEEMLRVSEQTIRKTIYPVGFYRNKAGTIRSVSYELIKRFEGKVPDTLEDLLSLKGVGRKTANLILSLGYGKDGLCVDTHVHRISNRLGFVQTKTPEQTEFALREILPKRYWSDYNTIMVSFGQHICRPISPFCSCCPVKDGCPRIGVARSR